MKTQFIVTITQTGDAVTAHVLADMVRRAVRDETKHLEATVAVRHAAEDEPAQPIADKDVVTVLRPALHSAIFDAHRAGQVTGRQLPKDSRDKATAFADQAVAVLAK